MKRGMKKSVVCLLSLVMLLTLLPMAAYAATGAATYPYLTFQDSNDFTIVGPQISYEEIKAVGLDASFVKHDIPDPWNVTWTSNNPIVAFPVPTFGDTNYVVLLDEGEATVTASYTCADGTVITCPSNVVSERRNNPTSVVNSVSVKVYGSPGSGIEINLPSLNVPLFTLKSVFGPDFDDADVLTKDPTALHALLYALELELDDDDFVWGDPGWDWDWVPGNVTIISQGSYVMTIGGDTSGWPVGWKYKLNDVELEKASSIAKLTTGSSVDWAFRE